MRTLRLEKYGKILINGEVADTSLLTDKSEFIKSIMLLDIEIGEDVNVGDMVHFFYESKDIVQSFFSEEYEVVRALVTATKLPKQYKALEIFKSLKIESDSFEGEDDQFLHFIPEVNFVEPELGEDGVITIGTLPLVINENVSLIKDGQPILASKTKITLFDLMVCLFEEIPAMIKEGIILSQ